MVELRDGNEVEVLGELPSGAPLHHHSLAPYATHLRLAGRATGHLALVDAVTGEVLARRGLGQPLPPSTRRQRPAARPGCGVILGERRRGTADLTRALERRGGVPGSGRPLGGQIRAAV